jgi:uncharacterized protein
VDVQRTNDPGAFRDAAGPLLLADEARHNLALGILSTARAQPTVYPEFHGWVARDGDLVVGAALRTPPHNLVLAQPADGEAIGALAAAIDGELPGVVGAVPEVEAFAAAWAELRGLDVSPAFDQRIYALREVAPPDGVRGAVRLAGVADRPLLLEWTDAFVREALHDEDDAARVERSVDARLGTTEAGFGIWEVDGRPASLAGFGGSTPNGIRIGPVYTPAEHRNHGYGTAVTAAVSQLLLERGHRFCFLYTDLANPTSNAMYQRIGYEPVCDSRELAFSARSGAEDALGRVRG